MARILISGFETLAGQRLADLLRSRRHLVDFCSHETHLSKDYVIRSSGADLVILDISRDDSETRDILAEAIRLRIGTGLRPMLLCVSQAYRGPRFEYELERKGVRLVYV